MRAAVAKMSKITSLRSTITVLVSSSSRLPCGRERIIEHDQLRFVQFDQLLEFVQFSRSHTSPGVRAGADLHKRGDHLDPGGFDEAFEFVQRFLLGRGIIAG